MRAIILFGFFLITLCGAACFAEDYGPTARGMFALLPESIFENTPEGLSEASKQELLLSGKSEFWEIAAETPDVLVFAERPFNDRAVALSVFRNVKDGSTEVAVGTLGEPICTVELWRMDTTGRIIPVDTPAEPAIGEFFSGRRKIRNGETVLICLGDGGLQAIPVLWDKNGFTDLKVDKEIFFTWDGTGFQKVVRPLSQRPRPDTSLPQNPQ